MPTSHFHQHTGFDEVLSICCAKILVLVFWQFQSLSQPQKKDCNAAVNNNVTRIEVNPIVPCKEKLNQNPGKPCHAGKVSKTVGYATIPNITKIAS